MLYNKVAIIGASITLASLISGCTKHGCHGHNTPATNGPGHHKDDEKQAIQDLEAAYNQIAANFTKMSHTDELSEDLYDEILSSEKQNVDSILKKYPDFNKTFHAMNATQIAALDKGKLGQAMNNEKAAQEKCLAVIQQQSAAMLLHTLLLTFLARLRASIISIPHCYAVSART